MKPLISVIVPVYKVESYLSNCVNSIIKQTYKNLEIILINDGSPDNCGSICDEYAKIDSRIKVIHKSNGGLSDARNVGLNICTGKYVTFVDSDDYIDGDYIMYLYELIKKHHGDISICRLHMTSKINEFIESKETGYYFYTSKKAISEMLYAKKFSTSACGKLYKSRLFESVRFPVGRLYEDMFTTYKLFLKSQKIVYGNRIGYYYYKRPGSIVTSSFSNEHLDIFDALDEIRDQVIKNDSCLLKAYYHQRILCMGSIFEISSLKGINQDNSLWQELKTIRTTVLFDKCSTLRVKMIALLSFFGIEITRMAIKTYYNRKWQT